MCGTTVESQTTERRKRFVAQELILPAKIREERWGPEIHVRRFVVERQFFRFRQAVQPARIPRVTLVVSRALDIVSTVSGAYHRHVRGINPKSEFGSGAQGIGLDTVRRSVRSRKIEERLAREVLHSPGKLLRHYGPYSCTVQEIGRVVLVSIPDEVPLFYLRKKPRSEVYGAFCVGNTTEQRLSPFGARVRRPSDIAVVGQHETRSQVVLPGQGWGASGVGTEKHCETAGPQPG